MKLPPGQNAPGGCGMGSSGCRPMWGMQREEEGRTGTEEMSAGEGEPGRAADPLPRQALSLPASVGSPAWRRQRNSRTANLSKEMWRFLGTARTSEVSLLEKARERRTETCDGF